MSNVSEAQRLARVENAAKAREGRRRNAAAVRGEASAAIAAAYQPVNAELGFALEAIGRRQHELASLRLVAVAMTLAKISASGPADPVRHRLLLASIREARALLPKGPKW